MESIYISRVGRGDCYITETARQYSLAHPDWYHHDNVLIAVSDEYVNIIHLSIESSPGTLMFSPYQKIMKFYDFIGI